MDTVDTVSTVKQSASDYIRLEDQFGAHNYHPLDVVVARAKGVWVWDVEGRSTWTSWRPIPP